MLKPNLNETIGVSQGFLQGLQKTAPGGQAVKGIGWALSLGEGIVTSIGEEGN